MVIPGDFLEKSVGALQRLMICRGTYSGEIKAFPFFGTLGNVHVFLQENHSFVDYTFFVYLVYSKLNAVFTIVNAILT